MPLLPRALFAGLFDDAAVFPPGSCPLDAAVASHRRLRRSPYADLVGSLLLPAPAIAAAADLAGLADLTDEASAGTEPRVRTSPPAGRLPADQAPPAGLGLSDDAPGTVAPLSDDAPGTVAPRTDIAPGSEESRPADTTRPTDGMPPPDPPALQDVEAPLGVSVIARPGADLEQFAGAVELARDDPRLAVRAVELGWHDGWRELRLDAPLIVLELPRGTEQALALTDIATAIAEDDSRTRRHLAKFRTGPTETWPWPAERELARAIQAAVAMDVPLKLTGGLHHAVRCTLADGEHHGVLNVLATFAAARAGRPVDALAGVLAERDPGALSVLLGGLGPRAVTRLRSDFAAYGCCTVTEPIGELVALGVLEGDS